MSEEQASFQPIDLRNWRKTGMKGEDIHEFHHYQDGVVTADLLGYVRHDPVTEKWQVIRPEPRLYDTADDARLALFGATDFDAWDGTTPPSSFVSRPRVVCLCGSTRFSDAFHEANLRETLAGRIVLSIGCDFKSDDALGLTDDDKVRLDELHLRKIDMADEVLILNLGGYVGQSTARELLYARQRGKQIRWLEPDKALLAE